MKITLLEVTDYMRVKKIVIAPGERSMVLIGGKNRQGKSSLIGAMAAALGGGKELPEEPIRKGQKRADIKMELDEELVVWRRFYRNEKGKVVSKLEVSSKTGKLTKPQQILDRLVGTRFLDPLRFMRLPKKEQRDVLLQCVDIGLDLDEHAKQRKAVYEERTGVNRDIKRLRVEFDRTSDPGEISDEVSTDDLFEKLASLQEQDKEKVAAQHKLEEMRADAERKRAEILSAAEQAGEARAIKGGLEKRHAAEMVALQERYDAEVAAMKARHGEEHASAETTISEADAKAIQLKEAYANFVEEGKTQLVKAEELAKADVSDEVDAITQSIKEAGAKNEERANLEHRKEVHEKAEKALEEAEAKSVALTADIKELDEEKASALAEANMPIEGLDVDEERVLYDSIPLSQASGAEQLQISLAIAAALSPELRDIGVTEGSLLDKDNLEQVHNFAKKNDLRVWLERAGEADDDMVIIEEGVVKV